MNLTRSVWSSSIPRITASSRPALTLVELLVVIAIISTLMGLLFPALQMARESARNTQCRNHLKQMGLGILNMEASRGALPPTFRVSEAADQRGNWSIHGFLLPYVEGGNAFARIDPMVDWHGQLASGIPQTMIPFYQCPSEVNAKPRFKDGLPYVAPTNYGFNQGQWFVYDPTTNTAGSGPFRVNHRTRLAEVTDGTSNTLAIAEVKAYTSYLRNTTEIPERMPVNPEELQGLTGRYHMGPGLEDNSGHTVWPDGRVHHTGFTTTFTPNRRVNHVYNGQSYDADYTTQQEGLGTTRPTYAAVTSRSYHPGGVNVAMLDGSIQPMSNDVDADLWQAMSTRAGHEVQSVAP